MQARRIACLTTLAILLGEVCSAYGQWPAAITTPEPLNANAAEDSGDDFYPQLTTDGGGNWVAVWQSEDDLDGTIGTDSDILISCSTDNAVTWTAPEPLNTNAATDGNAADWFPQLTTDRAGTWVAAWSSTNDLGGTIGTDWDILFSRSTDNGATWTVPLSLNGNADTDGGPDFEPQLTTDGAGHWVAAWESDDDLGGTIGTDRDILFALSTDNGVSWTAPDALNANAASGSGVDQNPQITTDSAGNWVAVWNSNDDLGGAIGTDGDILFARSADNGASWTDPEPLNTNAASDSIGDGDCQVATDGQGQWVAVWSGSPGMVFSLSTDNATTWTAPEPITFDTQGRVLQLTTEGRGNWVVVWHSPSDLDGAIGPDYDILFCRSADDGATWTAQHQRRFRQWR